MALNNFSPANTVVELTNDDTGETRQMTDWGSTATPYTDAQIDPRSQLIRGQGGGAIRSDRDNPGREVNLYLLPGSDDSKFVQEAYNRNSTVSMSKTVIGTNETATASDGVITNNGQAGRAGSTISDDQYTIQFNIWDETRGAQ